MHMCLTSNMHVYILIGILIVSTQLLYVARPCQNSKTVEKVYIIAFKKPRLKSCDIKVVDKKWAAMVMLIYMLISFNKNRSSS